MNKGGSAKQSLLKKHQLTGSIAERRKINGITTAASKLISVKKDAILPKSDNIKTNIESNSAEKM